MGQIWAKWAKPWTEYRLADAAADVVQVRDFALWQHSSYSQHYFGTGLLKRLIKRPVLASLRRTLAASEQPLARLLFEATQTAREERAQRSMMGRLSEYFDQVDLELLKRQINYSDIYRALSPIGQYRHRLVDYPGDMEGFWGRGSLKRRTLPLLSNFGINLDCIALREGEHIPPHAHRGVLSGFLVLSGEVGIRHFDVQAYLDQGVEARRTINDRCHTGQFTVNCEEHDNIHWLKGTAPVSVMFRLNIRNLPSGLPEYPDLDGRLYVDPTGSGDQSRVNFLPFVDEATAQVASEATW